MYENNASLDLQFGSEQIEQASEHQRQQWYRQTTVEVGPWSNRSAGPKCLSKEQHCTCWIDVQAAISLWHRSTISLSCQRWPFELLRIFQARKARADCAKFRGPSGGCVAATAPGRLANHFRRLSGLSCECGSVYVHQTVLMTANECWIFQGKKFGGALRYGWGS